MLPHADHYSQSRLPFSPGGATWMTWVLCGWVRGCRMRWWRPATSCRPTPLGAPMRASWRSGASAPRSAPPSGGWVGMQRVCRGWGWEGVGWMDGCLPGCLQGHWWGWGTCGAVGLPAGCGAPQTLDSASAPPPPPNPHPPTPRPPTPDPPLGSHIGLWTTPSSPTSSPGPARCTTSGTCCSAATPTRLARWPSRPWSLCRWVLVGVGGVEGEGGQAALH